MNYERKCLYCGKPFTTNSKQKMMCSDICKRSRNRELNSIPVDEYCLVCGKVFQKSKNSSRQTCSNECKKNLWSKSTRERKKANQHSLAKTEGLAREKGLHYADIQKQKTLAMVGGVKTELEPRKPRFIIYD